MFPFHGHRVLAEQSLVQWRKAPSITDGGGGAGRHPVLASLSWSQVLGQIHSKSGHFSAVCDTVGLKRADFEVGIVSSHLQAAVINYHEFDRWSSKHSFSRFSSLTSPRLRHQQTSCLMTVSPFIHKWWSLHLPRCEEWESFLMISVSGAQILPMMVPPSWPNRFQRPQLLIPLHWD